MQPFTVKKPQGVGYHIGHGVEALDATCCGAWGVEND
jgi:hypothetical protein